MKSRTCTSRATRHGHTHRKFAVGMAAAVASACLVLSACSSSSSSGQGANTEAGSASDTQTVKIALQPLLDYVPWEFAQEHGLAKEQGLNLKLSYITQVSTAMQTLARGDIDMVSTCTACNFPMLASVPKLREVLVTDQFKGFIIVGRKGAPQYNELIKSGKTPDEARQAVYAYLKGKTFIGNEATFGTLIDGLLQFAGLNKSDIKIINLATDPQAATAFLNGQGDFYMGSLAQESKLLIDHPDEFVNVGGAEVLGPGGLWYSTEAVMDDYLTSHEATVEKLVAVWMRTARYINEKPDMILPTLVNALNRHAGASFTVSQIKNQLARFTQFIGPQEAKKDVYNSDSDLYWKKSMDFYAKQSVESGKLSKDIDVDAVGQEQAVYQKVLANQKLMDWVNSPLT